jgi:hypothetical protein
MTSARLPDRSATTNSNPMFVGSMVRNEIVPSSFLRDATLLFHSPKTNVVAPAPAAIAALFSFGLAKRGESFKDRGNFGDAGADEIACDDFGCDGGGGLHLG